MCSLDSALNFTKEKMLWQKKILILNASWTLKSKIRFFGQGGTLGPIVSLLRGFTVLCYWWLWSIRRIWTVPNLAHLHFRRDLFLIRSKKKQQKKLIRSFQVRSNSSNWSSRTIFFISSALKLFRRPTRNEARVSFKTVFLQLQFLTITSVLGLVKLRKDLSKLPSSPP